MQASLSYPSIAIATVLVLVVGSNCQAGLFWRLRNASRNSSYVQNSEPRPAAKSPPVVQVSNAVTAPVSGAATSGAARSETARVETAAPAAGPACPTTGASTASTANAEGWHVLPNSPAEFGKWPPYYR